MQHWTNWPAGNMPQVYKLYTVKLLIHFQLHLHLFHSMTNSNCLNVEMKSTFLLQWKDKLETLLMLRELSDFLVKQVCLVWFSIGQRKFSCEQSAPAKVSPLAHRMTKLFLFNHFMVFINTLHVFTISLFLSLHSSCLPLVSALHSCFQISLF